MALQALIAAPGILCLNREFTLPVDGIHQLVPRGEFPVRPILPDGSEGELVIQVIDDHAITQMTNRFAARAQRGLHPELLIDFDHFSHDTAKESRAAGWVQTVHNRQDGAAGRVRWSASGKAAVEGGDYRFLSPVFDLSKAEHLGANRYRVTEIERLALTNDPNMRVGQPLSNRHVHASHLPAATANHHSANNSTMSTSTIERTQLIQLLGLDAAASDDQIAAAITKNRTAAAEVDDLRNRNKALLETQIERDLEEHKDVIADRDAVKAGLLANREGTLALLCGIKRPEATPAPKDSTPGARPVHNRAATTPPAASSVAAGTALTRDQIAERDALVAFNRSHHNDDFHRAWSRARSVRPDLFPADKPEAEVAQ